MPPTTGGSTIGSVASPRSSPLPGNFPRASSQASGNPKASAIAVLASEATIESSSACTAVWLVITLVMWPHGCPGDEPDQREDEEQRRQRASRASRGLNGSLSLVMPPCPTKPAAGSRGS